MEANYEIGGDVQEGLGFYVYRLVDPRTGATFYVGKGQKDRILAHLKLDASKFGSDELIEPKFELIRSIRTENMEPIPIIHRHGMSEKAALEVEAALIDLFGNLTNRVRGHGSTDRGVMHLKAAIQKYTAKQAAPPCSCLLVSVKNSINFRNSIADAARYCWRVDVRKASKQKLVLAIKDGLIRGVFEPSQWRLASFENFPDLYSHGDEGYGFDAVDVNEKYGYVGLRSPKPVPQLGFGYWKA